MSYYVRKIFLCSILTYFSALELFKYAFGIKIQYIILLITSIFLITYFLKAGSDNKYKYKKEVYFIIMMLIIYYIFVVINGVYFKDKARLIIGVYEYIIYSLPFFIPIFILYKDVTFNYIEKLIKIFILINFITSLLAFYEYTTGNYIIQNNIGEYISTLNNLVRAKVFNGSYLGLGAFIAQLSILNLYFIFNKKYTFKYKFLFFCSFIINVAGIIATNSRGPLVAWVIAIIIFVLLYYIFINFRKNNTEKSIGIIFIFLFIFISLCSIYYLINYKPGQINNYYLNNIFYRISSIFNWNNDKSNVLRKYFWYHFIYIFKQNFLYGIGIGSTGGRIHTTSIGPTESAVLKRFVELGIFGAIIFYLMIVYILILVFKYLITNINNFESTIMVITLFSSIFVIIVDGITYQICESQQTMFFNWFICGLLILIISKRKLLI